MSTLNINQFAQVAVRGQQDLSIARSGIISGAVSANQATPLKAGDAVLLDSAITVAGVPQFIAAGNSDVAFGYVVLDPKTASVAAPNALQVMCRAPGPVMWLLAAATIPPGATVEQATGGGYDVQGLASGKLRGINLDYATIGQLTRIMLTPAWV